MLNKNLSIKRYWKNDEILVFLIIFYYCGMAFNLFFKEIFREQAIAAIGYLFYGFFIVFYGAFLSCYIKWGVRFFVFSETLLLSLYILSFFQGNAPQGALIHNIIWSMGICIPLATVFYSIQNKEELYLKLYRISGPLLVVEMFTLFLAYGLNNAEGAYGLSLPLAMMFPLCIQIEEIFYKFSKKRFMLIAISLLSLVLWGGARRIFLMLGIYFLLKVVFGWRYIKSALQRILLLLFAAVSLMIFCVINFGKTKILTEILSGRIISLFSSGKIIYGAGRMDIYKDVIEKINKKLWLGWGLCGGWKSSGLYPHNIFLELWLAFGIVIGSGVILILLAIILNAIKNKCGAERKMLLIYIALSSGLLVSGPVTESVDFWILIALCLANKKSFYINKVDAK